MTGFCSATASPNSPYNWPMYTYPGFSSRVADYYTNTALPDENLILTTIPSIWASLPVDFNITIGAGTGSTVTNVTPSSTPENFTLTRVSADTYQVTGSASPMEGEYYLFHMYDGTWIKLPSNTTEHWKAVVKWNPPATPWERHYTYSFDVTLDYYDPEAGVIPGVQTTIDVSQYYYWSWEPSLQALRTYVRQGAV